MFESSLLSLSSSTAEVSGQSCHSQSWDGVYKLSYNSSCRLDPGLAFVGKTPTLLYFLFSLFCVCVCVWGGGCKRERENRGRREKERGGVGEERERLTFGGFGVLGFALGQGFTIETNLEFSI